MDLIVEIVLLMACAAVLGGLLERIGQSALLGYLGAGILLGPGLLNVIEAEEVIHALAEIGVAVLLFTIGLEVSYQRLKGLGLSSIGAGLLQISLTGLVVMLAAMAFSFSLPMSLTLGLALAPSSTATVLRLFKERGEMESLHGRSSLGILLLQDMALVPMAIVVSAMGQGEGMGQVVWSISGSMLVAVVVVFVAVVLNRTLLPWFVRQIVPRGNREIPILLSLTVCLGATWGAHHLHLSPAFGAFVAGMFLAGTPYAVQVRAEMGPLRTVFVALFFASIGLFADPRWMATHVREIIVLVFTLLILKTILTWLSCLVMRRGNRAAFATGICLCQGGEFGFVLGGMALESELFSRDTFMLMASVILVSLMVTPVLVKNAIGLAGRWDGAMARLGLVKKREGATEPPGEEVRRVIVIGFGPIGQRVCVRLVEAGVEPLVVDANPPNMVKARRLGYRAEVGDASLSEVLEHLHLEHVMAVVITIPDLAAARAITAHVRDLAPLVPVFARARYHVHALMLFGCGVEDVVDEEMESGLILGDRVLKALGLEIPETPKEMET